MPPPGDDIGIRVVRGTQSEMCHRDEPCLFLDRDGVIVEEVGYLHRPQDVSIIHGVAEAVKRANSSNVPVVVVTNQAGIGRGYYGWGDFYAVQDTIDSRLAEYGAHIDLTIACAYHEHGRGTYAVSDHPWRKPHPGMLFAARDILGIDLSRSYIVGDTVADLRAGFAAGLAGGALTLTGHGQSEHARHRTNLHGFDPTGAFSVSVVTYPAEAIVQWLNQH